MTNFRFAIACILHWFRNPIRSGILAGERRSVKEARLQALLRLAAFTDDEFRFDEP
jgi:hypothetical protein